MLRLNSLDHHNVNNYEQNKEEESKICQKKKIENIDLKLDESKAKSD